MKWLVYILVVINLGFAAWHFRGFSELRDIEAPVVDIQDEQQLVLISEYHAQQAENKKKAFVAAKLCFNVGPFEQKAKAQPFLEELKQQGINASLRRISDNSRRGYWVVLSTGNNRKLAQEKLAVLKKNKVTDFFLIATGLHANEISLGVFSQSALANKRVQSMQKLGLAATIKDVAIPKKYYWLEWSKDKNLDEDVLKNWQKSDKGLSQIERSCKK